MSNDNVMVLQAVLPLILAGGAISGLAAGLTRVRIEPLGFRFDEAFPANKRRWIAALIIPMLVGIAGATFAVSSAPYAETWTGHQKYLSGSSNCVSARTYDYMYAWDPATHTFTVANENTSGGKLTTIQLPAGNDVVNENFRSPSGVRFNIAGNVVTKDLVLTATDFGCKWTTPPKR